MLLKIWKICKWMSSYTQLWTPTARQQESIGFFPAGTARREEKSVSCLRCYFGWAGCTLVTASDSTMDIIRSLPVYCLSSWIFIAHVLRTRHASSYKIRSHQFRHINVTESHTQAAASWKRCVVTHYTDLRSKINCVTHQNYDKFLVL